MKQEPVHGAWVAYEVSSGSLQGKATPWSWEQCVFRYVFSSPHGTRIFLYFIVVHFYRSPIIWASSGPKDIGPKVGGSVCMTFPLSEICGTVPPHFFRIRHWKCRTSWQEAMLMFGDDACIASRGKSQRFEVIFIRLAKYTNYWCRWWSMRPEQCGRRTDLFAESDPRELQKTQTDRRSEISSVFQSRTAYSCRRTFFRKFNYICQCIQASSSSFRLALCLFAESALLSDQRLRVSRPYQDWSLHVKPCTRSPMRGSVNGIADWARPLHVCCVDFLSSSFNYW